MMMERHMRVFARFIRKEQLVTAVEGGVRPCESYFYKQKCMVYCNYRDILYVYIYIYISHQAARNF